VFIDIDHKQRQLSTLKTQSGARIEDLSLVFTLPGYDNIELKQNGKNEDVTLENLQEYIDLVMHFFFHETVKVQVQAFKKGFNQIFPVENLRPFSSSSVEMEDMICGTQRNEEEWTSVAKL
jgi:E3 ubiquitin-protein ligase TRIP12